MILVDSIKEKIIVLTNQTELLEVAWYEDYTSLAPWINSGGIYINNSIKQKLMASTVSQ